MTISKQPTNPNHPSRLTALSLPESVVDGLFDSNPLPMWIYDIQSLRFLAVNDSAIQHYGYSRDTFFSMTIADICPPEDVSALLENVKQVRERPDLTGVWRHYKNDGSLIFAEITSHPLDFMGRPAELVIAYDVSARVAAELDLNRLLKIETLIVQISRDLARGDLVDETIANILRKIGSCSVASRACLFQLDEVKKLVINTHEWRAAGVTSQKATFQSFSTNDCRWSLSHILQGLTLPIPDVTRLPEEVKDERRILEQQGIKSLIMVPVCVGQEVLGFLRIDNVLAAESWGWGIQRLLEMVAELIGTALKRRRDGDALQFSARQLDSIMRSAEHFVFYRAAVDPTSVNGGYLEFVSDSLNNIIGIEPDAEFSTWFSRVHPEDLPRLKAENAYAVRNSTAVDVTIRMFHPHRQTWRWIRAVSNPVRDAAGEVKHYNGFLLDVTDMVEASQALQAERDFANAVMDTVSALVVVLDDKGSVVEFNRACEQTTGYTLEEVQGRCVWNFLLLPEEQEAVQQVFQQLKTVRTPTYYENYWLTKDGQKRLISWSNTVILNEKGELVYVIGTGIDITEHKKAESIIRKLSSAVDQTVNGIMILDQQGIVEYVNAAYMKISGYPQESLIGKPAQFLGTPDNHSLEQARIWNHMLVGENWRGELQQLDKDGNYYWMSVSISPIRSPDSQTTNFVILIEDITELKSAHENLEYLASYDTLTGLPNRRLFRDRLEQAIKQSSRHPRHLALLYLDLDNFKRVNDSLGHDVGDILLCEVAKRLLSCVRQEDTVARLGGDEFVILLQSVPKGFDIDGLANKILGLVKTPITAADHEVVITCSIGITLSPYDAIDSGTLLRNADLAMYRSKGRGRDGYNHFESEMNFEVSRRLNMEAELRQALKTNQLESYFQPIVRLKDMQIVGFEALARWRHPRHGVIPPDQFIPVAEDCGLIVSLGEYLLEHAAVKMQLLRETHGEDIYVAVNLSARQAHEAKLVNVIVEVLERTGLPAQALHLEITESLLMKDFNVTRKLIEHLRENLSTHIAIDDFGTGYSSLSYLKQLPIDTLKVDRSFVKDIPLDVNDMEITAAIVAMAQALRKTVVAEGIETPEQLKFLQDQGCNFGQGYLFGRPAAPSEYLNKPLIVQLDA